MASSEAVERRREFRKLRKQASGKKTLDSSYVRACRIARLARDVETASRLCRKYFAGESPGENDIRGDLRYWKLRRCGWDVLRDDLCTLGASSDKPALSGRWQALVWQWWCELHYTERAKLIRLTIANQATVAGALRAGKSMQEVERLADSSPQPQ